MRRWGRADGPRAAMRKSRPRHPFGRTMFARTGDGRVGVVVLGARPPRGRPRPMYEPEWTEVDLRPAGPGGGRTADARRHHDYGGAHDPSPPGPAVHEGPSGSAPSATTGWRWGSRISRGGTGSVTSSSSNSRRPGSARPASHGGVESVKSVTRSTCRWTARCGRRRRSRRSPEDDQHRPVRRRLDDRVPPRRGAGPLGAARPWSVRGVPREDSD